jgi:ribA/ribD-fused uncharacterized protein
MKYSTQQLIEDTKQGTKPNFLFFWGHQPRKDGKITSSCLSQWWLSSFKDENYEYCCTEQFMMAEKARLFGDIETENDILMSDSPAKIKALGRKVKNFDEEKWLKNRYGIVRKANLLKFSQNTDLKEFLLSTGNKIIVEASPLDSIWGIALAKDHPDAEQPEKWKGLNLLGFALMEVRDELLNLPQ